MKLTVDFEKMPQDNQGTVWSPDVLVEYRLYDVDYLFRDRESEPLQRLEQAEILAVFFTINTCRFVICREVKGKWFWLGRNTYGNYKTFDNTETLKEAMTQMGAEIETEPDEYPEVEDFLTAFAKAIGVANIAILKHQKEMR